MFTHKFKKLVHNSQETDWGQKFDVGFHEARRKHGICFLIVSFVISYLFFASTFALSMVLQRYASGCYEGLDDYSKFFKFSFWNLSSLANHKVAQKYTCDNLMTIVMVEKVVGIFLYLTFAVASVASLHASRKNFQAEITDV